MRDFDKILFFADDAPGETNALTRAIELARQADASLTVMDVVARFGTSDKQLNPYIEQLQQVQVKERSDVLDGLIESLVGEDRDRITTRVLPGDKDFIEVIRTVVEEKFDILIKSINEHHVLSNVLFGNVDRRLLRQCPCPVWLIKPGHERVRRILAAVDLSRDEDESLRLADSIVKIGTELAAIESANLQVLTVIEDTFDATVHTPAGVEAYEKLLEAHREQTHRRFEHLTKKFADASFEEHIAHGRPSKAILDFVEDQDIDLLLMGTLSRTGIPGLFIGNTAERVLDEVNCSLIALKPDPFEAVL